VSKDIYERHLKKNYLCAIDLINHVINFSLGSCSVVVLGGWWLQELNWVRTKLPHLWFGIRHL